MSTIAVGDVYTIEIRNVTNKAGTVVDPTTLVVKVRKPGASTVDTYTYPSAEFTHISTGNYDVDIPQDTAGIWKADVLTTGTATLSEPRSWYCHPLKTT